MSEPVCKCGHPESEHDQNGCQYAVCQYTCRRFRVKKS